MRLFRSGFTGVLSTVVFFVVVFSIGCDRCSENVEEPPAWKFASQAAPYEVVFPGEWSREPDGAINLHADLEASRDERLFFIVIAEELPRHPPRNLLELKDEGIKLLDSSIDDLVVERVGPLELDGVSGLTVFASGEFDGESITYINSYVIAGDYGYQIIAYSDADKESKLFDEVDLILSHWQFTDDTELEDEILTDVGLRDDVSDGNSLPEPDEDDGTQAH